MSTYRKQAEALFNDADIDTIEAIAGLISDLHETGAALHRMDRAHSEARDEVAKLTEDLELREGIELDKKTLQFILKAIEAEESLNQEPFCGVAQYIDFRVSEGEAPFGFITDRASFKFGARN